MAVRHALFGRPLSERTPGFVQEDSLIVNALLDRLVDLLRSEHTDASRTPRTSRAFLQAEREIRTVQTLRADSPSAAFSRRALVLYGIWQESDFAEWLASERAADEADARVVRDLSARVLPLAGPLYLRGLGQRPDAFVALCATLVALWEGCAFELYTKEDEEEGTGEEGEEGGEGAGEGAEGE
jgi:hypothetical protein